MKDNFLLCPKNPPNKKPKKNVAMFWHVGRPIQKIEPFLTDPNQAIRVMVAMNPDADAEI